MAISNANLTTVASAVYTASGNIAVSTMYICNYSGSAITANVWMVPSGGSVTNLNKVYSTISIAANDTYVMDAERIVLGNGDTIQANVSANSSATFTLSTWGI